MEIDNIPSAWNALDESARSTCRFIKPTLGVNLFALNTTDDDCSKANNIMAIRRLRIKPHQCIPAHRHHSKEKIYLKTAQSDQLIPVQLAIYEGGYWNQYLISFAPVVVPAGFPHTLFTESLGPDVTSVDLLVIASSRDAKDIEWEGGIENLLKNTHLEEV